MNAAASTATLDAISGLLAATEPDPIGLLERVAAYLDGSAQARAAQTKAAWVSDWLRQRTIWLGRVGKLLTAAEVIAFSPSMKTLAAVHKARHEGRLLAIPVGERIYFPEFQFQADGSAAPWARELAALIPDGPSLLQFLGAARPHLKGSSYAEKIAEPAALEKKRLLIERLLAEARAQAAAEAA